MYFLFSYVFNQSLLGRRQVIIREEDVDVYTHVYACGKMPKNPLSIIFSYRRHHHVEFSGQENRMKKQLHFSATKINRKTRPGSCIDVQ